MIIDNGSNGIKCRRNSNQTDNAEKIPKKKEAIEITTACRSIKKRRERERGLFRGDS